MARFSSLFSSSSGNCSYIGSAEGGVLVDAGVSAKQINLKLDCIGVNPVDIGAIFVTHEHSDHVRGLRVFASKYNIPVYATQGTVDALIASDTANGSFEISPIPNDGIEIKGQFIVPFKTSHDSKQSCGYVITTSDDRKIAVATDTGIITDETRAAVRGCDLVLAESNHDIGMLRNGPYPYLLKRRILSDVGHLSNIDCSKFVTELVESGTTRILLGHLSKENNIPELAFQTTKSALDCAGAVQFRDYILKVAGGNEVETVVL
jgi:phosphoribosyl 1,2-cyclic phosphodiesterase